MREIKFRAWDRIRMYNVEKLVIGDVSYPDEVEGYNIWGEDKSSMILMQYTGLKDKNGKEIYEGDIVLYPTTESEYVDVGVGNVKVAEQQINNFYPIEFFEGEFGMNVKQDDETLYKGWQSLKEIKSCVDYIEIIGNIYENPELLTSSQSN